MEAGLKQNRIEALNAASWSFKMITESLLKPPEKEHPSHFRPKGISIKYVQRTQILRLNWHTKYKLKTSMQWCCITNLIKSLYLNQSLYWLRPCQASKTSKLKNPQNQITLLPSNITLLYSRNSTLSFRLSVKTKFQWIIVSITKTINYTEATKALKLKNPQWCSTR